MFISTWELVGVGIYLLVSFYALFATGRRVEEREDVLHERITELSRILYQRYPSLNHRRELTTKTTVGLFDEMIDDLQQGKK